MTAHIEALWFVSCDVETCTLNRQYCSETAAEEAAAAHNQPGGCPGASPWIDKKPRPRFPVDTSWAT